MLIAIIIIGCLTVVHTAFLAFLVKAVAHQIRDIYKHEEHLAELYQNVIQNRQILNQILKAVHLHSKGNNETIH
jgi:hypothetical protein